MAPEERHITRLLVLCRRIQLLSNSSLDDIAAVSRFTNSAPSRSYNRIGNSKNTVIFTIPNPQPIKDIKQTTTDAILDIVLVTE